VTESGKQILNISYYNQIAIEYDGMLEKDNMNEVVRRMVSEIFIAAVPNGMVIDFGGGTGLDMRWMVENKYSIIFCEPSTSMREIAIERATNNYASAQIRFLNEQDADFKSWKAGTLFTEKADGLLANFAVINCIDDVNLLFKNFALALKPGATVLALVLKAGLSNRFKKNIRSAVQSIITREPVSYNITYKGHTQMVTLHTIRSLKKMSAGFFRLKKVIPIRHSEFCLIHLIRQ
jgi:SAM-dependent methyltransferase